MADKAEMAQLTERYGHPARWSRSLAVSDLAEWRKRGKDHPGEVVLVFPRPGGRILLHTKEFYPPGAFRLPTGGINQDERIKDAVARETREETGLRVSPVRWLGIVDYSFRKGSRSASLVSYVFLMAETDETPRQADIGERIAQFREIEWVELPHVAEQLEELPDEWRDWGRFRAVPHRLVYERLSRWP